MFFLDIPFYRTHGVCQFELRYSERENWEKLVAIGEQLLAKFVGEEASKFEQILAIEAPFSVGISNLSLPFIGVLDLVALIGGKKTLLDFKTASADYEDYEALLSDQLTAYWLAGPEIEQAALCVLVKKRQPEIVWHFTERSPEQQIEYLEKTATVAEQIATGVFYKRVGFWCRQCDFLPVCTGDSKKAHETLLRII